MLVRERFLHWCFPVLAALAAGLLVGFGDTEAVATEEAADAANRQESERIREIVELRDATSKTYELVGGQREWVTNGDVIHYQDVNGVWQEVDNSLVADAKRRGGVDYAYSNAANGYTVRFAGKARGGADLVCIEVGSKSIAFSAVGARHSESVKNSPSTEEVLPETDVARDTLVYAELYPGVDVSYEATGSGLKEYLVLKEAGARNRFTFALKLDGVTAQESGGQITFVDEKGKAVFWLGDAFAVDGAGTSTEDVDYELLGKKGNLQLVVTLSRAYLDDPARVFPVVVDPPIYIYPPNVMDTCVCSGTPWTTYGSDTNLRTGWSSETRTRWTLIWFNLAGLNIDPDWIDHCYIRLKKCYGANPVMRAYPCIRWWESTSATWNNKPGVAWEHPSTQAVYDGNSWWKMESTYPVKRWLSGAWGNCGWTVVDTRNSQSYGSWFWSANYVSPHRPELHIWYTVPSPPAGTLVHYPSYTYSEPVHSSGYVSDPLNLFFCDAVSGGTWGSADGVRDQVAYYMGYLDGVLGDNQHVLFEATYGAARWVRNDHQMGTRRTLLSRYHLRIFENPYDSLSGYPAGRNCAANIHHDGSWTHHVDQDWEVTERIFSTELDSRHPRVSVTHNNLEYHNHPAGLIGDGDRYSDGYMTTCRFY